MKKALKTIRATDWWSHKLSPLLTLCYATALFHRGSVWELGTWLLFILISVAVGAVYVSLINDYTDIKEDSVSGKTNQMAKFSPIVRWILIFSSLGIGLWFVWLYRPDIPSMILFFMPCISFSLYSFPPFRLKKRGIWGLLADASGSHLFTSLLMITTISYQLEKDIPSLLFALTGIWALTYGLRGILYHQFTDRDNDEISGTKTYVVELQSNFKGPTIILSTVECIALIAILTLLKSSWPFIFLGLYFLAALARRFFLHYKIISIKPPQQGPYQILLADFYQLFFPIGVLIAVGIYDQMSYYILLLHLIIFPHRILDYFREIKMITKRKLKFS